MVTTETWSANRFKPYPKQWSLQCRGFCDGGVVYSLGPILSLLPEQVQHNGLHIMSKGTGSHHQPVRAESGVSIDHTLGDIHLWRGREQKICTFNLPNVYHGDLSNPIDFHICMVWLKHMFIVLLHLDDNRTNL